MADETQECRMRIRKNPIVMVWDGDTSIGLRPGFPRLECAELFCLDGCGSCGITRKGLKTWPVREDLEMIYCAP